MKKLTKGCLIAVLIFIVTGSILFVIAYGMGGVHQMAKMALEGELSFGPEDLIKVEKQYDLEDVEIFDKDYTVYTGEMEKTALGGKEIKELKIEFGGGMIHLEPSNDEWFNIRSKSAGKFQAYIEDDTIYIKGMRTGWEKGELYLYIPAGISLSDCDISLGGGIIDSSKQSLEADKVSIRVGAGQVEIQNIQAQEAVLEVGAGEVLVDDCDVMDMDTKVGAGRVMVKGRIWGDLESECGMGETVFVLNGKETDHNYDLQCFGGNISVGSYHASGIAFQRTIDNGKDSDFELECALGNMEISFEE